MVAIWDVCVPSDGVSVRQVFVVSDFLVTTLLNLISPFFFRGCCFLWRQFLECTGRLAKRPDQIHANCCCELNTGNAAAWHAMQRLLAPDRLNQLERISDTCQLERVQRLGFRV